MENFSCIMYIESRLLYNNITSTMLNKQDLALFIAHENFITKDTFNQGISKYLKNHLYSIVEKTDRWQNLNEQMITDNILLPRNTSLSGIMNAWIDQISYPYVEVIRAYSINMILISQHQFLFDVKAQPPNSPDNYQWYIPFQFKSL
ncbi:unnamed protein product [Rotaria sordida]|uniref:Uncharacterized protein n=1 Tax=Rotaria sordida TaxID=392033 RepID=A0A814P224_9BILA|nr:unnamed protein product [Rotaria sordida]CAF1303802.1 unnamed protein product [Rotaria sordida]